MTDEEIEALNQAFQAIEGLSDEKKRKIWPILAAKGYREARALVIGYDPAGVLGELLTQAAQGQGTSTSGAGFSGPSIKRPRGDTSAEYLEKLLAPELTELPEYATLPQFVATDPRLKLPVMNSDYVRACARCSRAAELLIPFPWEEPDAEQLACRVSAVLNGKLRNVAAEDTLHHDVDDLFEKMFDLASESGLLVYQSERNAGDSLSGTTGRCLRPDFLLWVGSALLFKGEEKASARELPTAEKELLSKMTSTWNTRVYGQCPYMLGYAVGGPMLKIVAIRGGHQEDLIVVDMSTLLGKLGALVAVVNILRLLRVMAKHLPTIAWGVGQSFIVSDDEDRIISTVTNMGGHVHKELRNFEDTYRQYTPPHLSPLQFLQSVYAAIVGANHLVQAKTPPTLRGSTYEVDLQPVGLAYRDAVPQDVEEAKLAIRGVLLGCGELHSHGFVHRDLRWPNVVKVIPIDGGGHTIKLIDLELAGQADAPCSAPPYPLRHWLYGDGRSVLDENATYTARSDLRMVGKELMGKLTVDLGDCGHDLRQKLESGVYEDAGSALAHAWFNTV